MSVGTTAYQANLYPNPVSADGALGVCFSGGGSRALSCALGQLSALNTLPSPKTSGATLLNEVSFISSVSGGSWASVAYTFLPATISDSDFLIAPAAPSALTTTSVSSMNPQCLGSVPQQFNVATVTDFVELLWNWGFFNPLGPDVRSWFWIAAVGELILKPFGLYSPRYSSSSPYLLLDRTFSVSPEYISEKITLHNPSLDPSRFYVCRPGRPTLIVNANMQESHTAVDPTQIPFQGTARATGILGGSPDETIEGGGLVESFAFASLLNGAGAAPNTAAVEAARCYSLCDLAGCSSAFFAEYLLQYVNDAIDDIVTELAARYHLSPFDTGLVEAALKTLVDHEAAELLPKYNYWPLSKVGQPAPTNSSYTFTDGGTFDNSGILGLLAQTDVSSVVAFVNTETPLGKANGQITVDTLIPLLFGSAYPGNADPAISGEPYSSLGGMSSLVPMSYVQVFDNLHGELDTLCQGLYDASCGGPNRDDELGTYPACFIQLLTTVANPVANIKGGRQVTVLWVYSNRINNWQNEITDAGIRTALLHGQSNQNPDGTLINRQGSGSGLLANFPHYDTVEQIYLAPEAVNMLAQLSAWTVQQAQAQIGSLLEVQAQKSRR